VLLQVVAFAADVSGDFLAVGETYTCNLTERGVRLLRGDGLYLEANATLLRACCEVLDLLFRIRRTAGLADELIDRWHGSIYVSVWVKG
jgi:hypothetical protein